MEFWEILYFTSFIVMILLFLWKISNIWKIIDEKETLTAKDRSNKLMMNFIFFALNAITYLAGFLTFMVKNTEILLISLTNMMGILFLVNVLFFIIEFFFSLESKTDQVVKAYNSKENMIKF